MWLPNRLAWQLFFGFLAIILIAMVLVTITTSRYFERAYIDRYQQNLSNQAALCADIFKVRGITADTERLDPEVSNIAHRLNISIAVIYQDGRILVSDEKALNKTGDMIFGSAPVNINGTELATVRVSVPFIQIERSLNALYIRIVGIGIVILFGAAIIGYAISRRITTPIRLIQDGAARFASGDLDYRLRIEGIRELEQLASSMNSMASQLDDRVRTVESQRLELEGILSSMIEAVIVVDNDERLIKYNAAARELFKLSLTAETTPSIQTVIRNPELHRFIRKSLSYSIPIDAEISVHNGGDRVLKAHGAALNGSYGNQIGALIVMHDVTNLKRLETIRKEFVANVSHELKTPITSIMGFIETLQNGALEDTENATRFLEIIARQSERLGHIIDDLLSLSRIEMDSDSPQNVFEQTLLLKIVRQAIAACQEHADTKQIAIEFSIADDLQINVNPPIFEQALINLIDNAIKYSDTEKTVRIVALRDGGQVKISVIDQGFGIARDHLPRIFERFYRVDKARSRKLGGTGLGLAIVKHIAQAHGGTVEVTSILGEGSIFKINLPV